MLSYTPFAVILVAAVCWLLWLLVHRTNFTETCETLTRKLPPDQYEMLCDLVDRDPVRNNESHFWKMSHGIKGQMLRLRTSTTYLRLVQAHYYAKQISRDEARTIWGKLAAQAWFSVLAMPEAGVCWLFGSIPHIAARASLRFYCDIVIQSQMLCVTEDAPECLLELNNLL